MFIATVHYRKKAGETEGRKTFAGVFATVGEAELWVRSALYGSYKDGKVTTDSGGVLHLTEVQNAFHVAFTLTTGEMGEFDLRAVSARAAINASRGMILECYGYRCTSIQAEKVEAGHD